MERGWRDGVRILEEAGVNPAHVRGEELAETIGPDETFLFSQSAPATSEFEIGSPLAVIILSDGRHRIQVPPEHATAVLSRPLRIDDPYEFAVRLSLRVTAIDYDGRADLLIVPAGQTAVSSPTNAPLLRLVLDRIGNRDNLVHRVQLTFGAGDRNRVDAWTRSAVPGYLVGEPYRVFAGVRKGILFCRFEGESPAARNYSFHMERRMESGPPAFEGGDYRIEVRGRSKKKYTVIELGSLSIDGGSLPALPKPDALARARRAFCATDFEPAAAEFDRAGVLSAEDAVARRICEFENKKAEPDSAWFAEARKAWPEGSVCERLFWLELRTKVAAEDVAGLKEMGRRLKDAQLSHLLRDFEAIVRTIPALRDVLAGHSEP